MFLIVGVSGWNTGGRGWSTKMSVVGVFGGPGLLLWGLGEGLGGLLWGLCEGLGLLFWGLRVGPGLLF